MNKWVIGLCLLLNFSGQASQKRTLRERDVRHLEVLKQKLEELSDKPGALHEARDIQRQIDLISRGADLTVPVVQSKAPPSLAQRPAFETHRVTPKKATPHSLNITDSASGRDVDLFHERTILVGEDYGVSREKMRQGKEEIHAHDTLKMPGNNALANPWVDQPRPQTQTPGNNALANPWVDQPRPQTPPTHTREPNGQGRREPRPAPVVDAPQFQSTLYGDPERRAPPARVVPSTHQPKASHKPRWGMNRSEADYLEERLKTVVAQLVHARKQLEGATPDAVDAWTSRIYELETKKRSLLRMLKEMGVTPRFKSVSLNGDTGFDTVQSEEFLLKRQLLEMEKRDKKIRRQIRHTQNPERKTALGAELAKVARNQKLLEASLRHLKDAQVNQLEITKRPHVYQQPVDPEPVHKPTPKKPEPTKPAPVEHVAPPQPKVMVVANASPSKKKTPFVDDDDGTDPQDRGHFWNQGLQPSLKYPKPKGARPAQKRVSPHEAQAISASWLDD